SLWASVSADKTSDVGNPLWASSPKSADSAQTTPELPCSISSLQPERLTESVISETLAATAFVWILQVTVSLSLNSETDTVASGELGQPTRLIESSSLSLILKSIVLMASPARFTGPSTLSLKRAVSANSTRLSSS